MSELESTQPVSKTSQATSRVRIILLAAFGIAAILIVSIILATIREVKKIIFKEAV